MAVIVPIVSSWDPKGVDRSIRDLQKAEGGWAKAGVVAEKAFLPAVAAIGALTVAGKKAIDSASAQEQAFGGLQSVFKTGAPEVEKWARNQAAIGLSATEAAEAATYMGSMLKNAGMNMADSAAESQRLTELGADLAATFGGPASDAVNALGAALRGEMDPIERYGVSVKQADINAAMAEKGLTGLTGEARKQAEMMTRLELVTAQTADAQGQAGREANTTAGRTAALQANTANLAAEIGTSLLPYYEKFLGVMQSAIGFIDENQGLVLGLAVAVGTLASAVIAINVAMKVYRAITAAVAVANAIMGTSFTIALGPVALVIAAIVAVIAVGVLLVKNWSTISAWMKSMWTSIKNATVAAWAAMRNAVSAGITAVVAFVKAMPGKVVSGVGNMAATLFGKGRDLILGFIRGYVGVWGRVLSFVGDIPWAIVRGIGNLGSALFGKGQSLIQGFINGIKSMAGRILQAILGILPGPVRGIIGGALGLRAAPLIGSGATRAADSGGTRSGPSAVTVNGTLNPQETARALAGLLSGAQVRTGFAGVRA